MNVAASKGNRRVLVVGIGNPLRGDDGAGPTVVERLPIGDYDAIAVHQLLPEHAATIHLYERVVFIDACVDLPAGQWRIGPVDSREPTVVESHGNHPAWILSLCHTAFHSVPISWCLRIGGRQFELGATLSPCVRDAIDNCMPQLLALLGSEEAAHA